MDSQSIGKLILRVMVGGLMLFHGFDKILHGVKNIEGMMAGLGLPHTIAYGVFVGEVIAPILLIIGWKSRWWGGLIAFNMAVAIYLVHAKTFWTLGTHGAWSVELPMLYLLAALAISFVGSGKYALSED